MLVFLDTEFTDLVIQPRLLSVALVTDLASDREFYAEVTDTDRIPATNWFGLSAVLPQFGTIADAACNYAELGARLATSLHALADGLQTDELIEIIHTFPLDWELVDLAIKDSGSKSWASTRFRVRPVNVYELTSSGPRKLATEAYFKAQAVASFSRHHVLCDARAMHLACQAATRATARPSKATAPEASDHADVKPGTGSSQVIYIAIAAELVVAAARLFIAAHAGTSAMLTEGLHSMVEMGNEMPLALPTTAAEAARQTRR